MNNPQFKATQESILLLLMDKLEMHADALNKQDELLKRISDRSPFWGRLNNLIQKLESLESFLAVRK